MTEHGLLRRQNLTDNHLFMLQSFIVVKKALQHSEPMRRKFTRFLITVVFRIVHMNGNAQLACGEERTVNASQHETELAQQWLEEASAGWWQCAHPLPAQLSR
jgi:hypothetical protein